MADHAKLRAAIGTEADLLRSVLQILTARGVFCWRNNAGLTLLGSSKSRRVVRGAPAGSPDILGVIPGSAGRLFGLELKAPNGRLLASQRRWAERAAKHGIAYGVARDTREAMALIENWKNS